MRKQKQQTIPEGYAGEVGQALYEWKAAQQFFECVSEPELVDYAIFEMEAARRRYIYLLNKQKRYNDSDTASAPKDSTLLPAAQRYIQMPVYTDAPASNQ